MLFIPEDIKDRIKKIQGYTEYFDITENVDENRKEELLEKVSEFNGKPIMLSSKISDRCKAMLAAAKEEGLDLVTVSGHRSKTYQQKLLERAVESGRSWDDILDYIALPGYSQHHTGQALDVTTTKLLKELSDPLVARFADTEEYSWLLVNMDKFGFKIPYNSRCRDDNPGRFAFEPWHIFFSLKEE